MPFAGFKDFDDCVKHMMEEEGYSEEKAKKVCGKLQTIHENSMEFPSDRRDVEGGFLIPNVTILAAGVWNGTKYSALELAKAANKWRSNAIWNRHYEGKSRDESNQIGLLKNQRFDDYRVAADVFLSNSTPEGCDMIALVKEYEINGISVEHVDIPVNGEATNIEFLGAAIVPEPACVICQLSKEEKLMEDKEFKELQGTVAELAKSVKELSEVKSEVKTEDFTKLNDAVGELSKGVAELGKTDVAALLKEQADKDSNTITELEKRIKELEDLPEGTGAGVASDIEDTYAGLTFGGKEGIHRSV